METTCAKLTSDVNTITVKNEQLEFTCEQLSTENRELKSHSNEFDNYSRRSNIVIRGIEEP